MHVSSVRYHSLKTQGLVLLAALGASPAALAAEEAAQLPAEPAAPQKAAAEPALASVPPAEPAAPQKAATEPALPSGMPPWQKAPGIDVRKPGSLSSDSTLEWHGNLETDLGYAEYTFSSPNYKPEKFHDFRGRFVIGPVLEHDFGSNMFVRATGQAVTWIRDATRYGYQINADDVYGQVGKKGVWDLKFGRFMSWTVYRKGLGYDLYTLEDTGALKSTPVEAQQYGVRYEVNTIWYRENEGYSPGRLALHLYPTSWSGIELLGQYARNTATDANQLGGRAAVNVHSDYASVSVGAEWLQVKPGGQQTAPDANGNDVVCDTCNLSRKYGFGGGVVSKPVSFIELGLNGAMGFERAWGDKKEDDYNKSAEATIKATGGYLQFDVGKVAFNRNLIIGAGPNYTTRKTATNDQETHLQVAGYIAFPLGFNNSVVKIVVTEARDKQMPSGADPQTSNAFAARIRFAMYY